MPNNYLDEPCGARINFNNETIPFASFRDIYIRRNIENLVIIFKGSDNENITCNYKQFSQYEEVKKNFALLAQEEKAARREPSKVLIVEKPDLEDQVLNATDAGMEFNLKDAKSVIGEFNGYKNEVVDYVEAINYYNDSLKDTDKNKLIEFICKISLKGKAKDAVTTKPATVEEIGKVLLARFKEKETITGLQKKLSEAMQGQRSVSNYVAHLEQVGSKLRVVLLAEMGQDASDYIKKATNQVMLSALKSGLNGDARMAVLAANPSRFDDAIGIALSAEASGKERGETAGVFHTRHSGGNSNYWNPRGGMGNGRGHPNQGGHFTNNDCNVGFTLH